MGERVRVSEELVVGAFYDSLSGFFFAILTLGLFIFWGDYNDLYASLFHVL